jgi:hypothetical protein
MHPRTTEIEDRSVMSIEDLIREANPVKTSDLAAGDSPPAQRALAQILRDHPAPGAAGRRRRARRGGKPALITAALAATAAGVTAVGLVLAVPGAAHRPAPTAAPAPRAHPGKAQFTTAREVLLAAATHVAPAPVTGRYWRVQQITGETWPGGTKAHPYDISLSTRYDQWNPRSPGEKEWEITQQLGTRPATPADAAAWRAAGSPTTWRSGENITKRSQIGQDPGGYPPRMGALAATTAASAPSASWTVSDGTVGYVEGDLPGLNAAQFRRMPTSPRGVAALLRHYMLKTYCGQHNFSGCSTPVQFVWSEALELLEDPVSAPVRSATFKVMAALPGVRLLGPMTDPLGRRGYGLAAGGPESDQSAGVWNPSVSAIVIDPRTGSLLAMEDIGPMAGNELCTVIDAGVVLKDAKAPIVSLPEGTGECVGSAYDGRSYQDQVDAYVAWVGAGWTNASPVLPRSTQQAVQFPGLPPVGGPPDT